MPYLRSQASATVNTAVQIDDWWIKDPLGYEEDVLVHVSGDELSRERMQQTAAFRPIGRRHPVLVSDVVEGFNGQLDIEFVNDPTGYEKLLRLFGTQRVLLLQSGWLKEQMYVRFRDNWREKILNSNPPYRIITVNYIEQERPHES